MRKLAIVLACAFLWLGLLTKNSAAQSEYVADVGNGLRIYELRCANCHGSFGEGDGQIAAQAVNPPTPIGTADYLFTSIPNNMFDTISNGRMQAGMPPFGERSSNPLSEQERWDVIAAMYALGSNSAELPTTAPELSLDWQSTSIQTASEQLVADGVEQSESVAAAFAWRLAQTAYALDDTTVRGTITNGTTGEPIPNLAVNLVAFEKFSLAQELSAETNEQGEFELNATIYADWILRAETAYNDIEYASDFLLLSAETVNPTANITVFDNSDDATGMMLNRLHTIVNVTDGMAFVSQLYSFSNLANTVYTGGVPLILPDEAESTSFNVITGGNQIVSADTVEQTNSGAWRDTQPVPPGEEVLSLLVRYGVPTGDVLQLAHNLSLPTANATLVLPADYELSVGDGWLFQASDQIEGRQFLSYATELGDGVFSAEMTRSTKFMYDAAGNRVKIRNESQELVVGAIGLVLTIVASAYLLYQWQRMAPADPTGLLQEIAALDDAFAAKQIKRKPYQTRRKQLLQQLKDIWTTK